MADEKELVNWLFKNADDLHLEVEQLSWIDKIFPGYVDVVLSITLSGQKFVGFGTSDSQDAAILKALSESLERAVVSENKFPTSNGVAANPSKDRAIKASINELLERDLALCHFYTSIPYPRIDLSLDLKKSLSSLYGWCGGEGISISFFYLGDQGALFVAEGSRARRRFGYIVGSARKNLLEESIYAAAFEGVRQIFFVMEKQSTFNSIDLAIFESLTKPNFIHHVQIGLNDQYARMISPLFSSNGSNTIKDPKVSIDYEELRSCREELQDCPLFFMRARCEDLQNIFLGSPDGSKINLDRLSAFSGRPILLNDVPAIPHLFG